MIRVKRNKNRDRKWLKKGKEGGEHDLLKKRI